MDDTRAEGDSHSAEPPPQLLLHSLQIIRRHLGMEVAFISEFTEGRRVFRCVDAALPDPPIAVGGSDPL
ncbi:hypothetical protein [Pelomonas sp. KK5]|uniref:hypothetical protein n=1 Tax=Pelomonas sp. KK5 TaxID=1855730 RepID=UPI00097CAB15|nr:hypothetical protein [Pelomonas sp. KK5]